METPLSRSAFVRGVGGALAGYLALSGHHAGAQSSVEERADAALKEDDTAKAVAIWEAEYRKWAFDDDVRASLHRVLVIHAYRSLDKSELVAAAKALQRAKELVPESSSYQYLDNALDAYQSNLYQVNMEKTDQFDPVTKSDWSSEYVTIPGVLGGQTVALLMVEDEVSRYWYYKLDRVVPSRTARAAIRMQVNPQEGYGHVAIMFGLVDSDHLSVVTIERSGEWAVSGKRYGEWIDRIGEGSVSFSGSQWHAVELRIRGKSIEIWLDYQMIADEYVSDLDGGYLGFGVGTRDDSSHFTAAFDDIAIYALK